ALRALSPHDGPAEYRLRPRSPEARPGRDSETRERAARARSDDGLQGSLSLAAFRRTAPASRAGAGARAPSEGALARRTVRRARRPGARRAALLAAPPARRGPCDKSLRHTRPERGFRGGRPSGRPEPRQGRTNGPAR